MFKWTFDDCVKYGNIGCQVSNEGIQNWLDVWQKINVQKGNYHILSIEIATQWQKSAKCLLNT